MQLNGSQILMEVLLEQGVDTIFGYPGGAVLNIYDAVYSYSEKIRHIITAHEQGAAHAADGYARATGRTGVVLATSGPGATNLVTGIAAAYMDSVPMVAITGNVDTKLIGKDSFQEAYTTGITMPITKHNYVVQNVDELADILRDAFRIASTGRKGPVLVDIPKDVSADVTEFCPKLINNDTQATIIAQNDVDEIARLISDAKRPVAFVGGGIIASDACGELLEFIRRNDIPAVLTMMATGALRYDEELNLGLVGMHGGYAANTAVYEADTVIALGTRFSDRSILNTGKFAKNAVIIQVDIDCSEINKNVHTDYSIVGNLKDVLRALNSTLSGGSHTQWLERIAGWKEQEYVPAQPANGIAPLALMQSISGLAGNDAVYVTDVGEHQLWATKYLHHMKPRHFLSSGGLGAMGYGYGAAIGAKLACMDKPVIHITGDGSFHMNMNEACTAVSYEIPVITIILNNSALGLVREYQHYFYDKRYSCTVPRRKTDYVKVADGFGLSGYRCSNISEVEAAFAQALKMNTPAWIECMIDRDEMVLPLIPTDKTVDDIIMK